MGKQQSKENSVNNIAPVQNIKVENELSSHDLTLYILFVVFAAILIFITVALWCRKNERSHRRLKKELETIQELKKEIHELKKCVVYK